MKTEQTKKLALKKETLRTLDTQQLQQLEGAAGGTITIPVIIGITISKYAYDVYTRQD